VVSHQHGRFSAQHKGQQQHTAAAAFLQVFISTAAAQHSIIGSIIGSFIAPAAFPHISQQGTHQHGAFTTILNPSSKQAFLQQQHHSLLFKRPKAISSSTSIWQGLRPKVLGKANCILAKPFSISGEQAPFHFFNIGRFKVAQALSFSPRQGSFWGPFPQFLPKTGFPEKRDLPPQSLIIKDGTVGQGVYLNETQG